MTGDVRKEPAENPARHPAEAPDADAARRVEAEFARARAALAALRPGARLLLGISAGGDSMALLDLAARNAAAFGWTLSAAHLDHAVRAESAEEAEFVRARCSAVEVPLVIERLAPATPRATEETMRRARHEFFARAARASGATCLALAHQLDDRAETFLIRLLAGSGPTGLGSIRPERELNGMTVVRPLLGARRADLRGYLRARGLDWRDDPSNEDVRQKRAWLRREIIPRMDAWMGLEVAPRVALASELIAAEADALTEACGVMLEHLGGGGADEAANERAGGRAKAEPPAELAGRFPTAIAWLRVADPMWTGAGAPLRGRLIRQWLWRAAGRETPPGREAVEEALKFIERGSAGTRLRTIRRLQLEKADGWLVAFPEPTVDHAA